MSADSTVTSSAIVALLMKGVCFGLWGLSPLALIVLNFWLDPGAAVLGGASA